MAIARLPPAFALCLILCFATPVLAQESAEANAQPSSTTALSTPAANALNLGTTEWMATIGNAWGIALFHSTGGYRYLSQTLSWGKVLTGPKLPGMLRGRFEWAVEVMPVFGQYRPDNVYGVALAPFAWRWNFEPRGRYAPYTELAGGLLWTTSPVPLQTTKANFLAHVALGTRVMLAAHHAIVFSYRLEHISNGNRLEDNPGINAHALHVGWSVLRR